MTDPLHVAIIMDGNRRLAKRLMKEPWKGHEYGAKKVYDFLGWCKELNIKYVTLYSFSIQNFSRPKEEFDFLMDLFEREFKSITDPNHDAHKNKIRVRVMGRVWMLPERVQKAIRNAEEATKNYNDYHVNFAIAYGGQEEITDGVRDIAKKVSEGILKPEDIDEQLIRHSLYTDGTPYPDFIMRTGGEKRISNFLLWQGAYSELLFLDKMWPEIEKEDLVKAVEEFKARDRRFGR